MGISGHAVPKGSNSSVVQAEDGELLHLQPELIHSAAISGSSVNPSAVTLAGMAIAFRPALYATMHAACTACGSCIAAQRYAAVV